MRFLSLLSVIALALCAPLAWSADITDTVLLVAKRNLKDRIYGSSILVARPLGDDRHVGFIVNKPTTMTLGKLFPKHLPSQKVVDPVYLGDLSQAGLLESLIGVTMGVARGGLGPFFYRFTGPGGLSTG